MTPEETQQSQDATTTTTTQDAETVDSLPVFAQKIIKDLREENKQRRKAVEDAEKERTRIETERLQEQGKFKELFEGANKELEPLKQAAERATVLEAAITAHNEKRITRIPENMRTVVPSDYTPEKLSEWLDKNEAILAKPTAPQTDAGAQGTPANSLPKLTPEEQTMARALKMSDEEYVKYKRQPTT